jgi:hypothetical protein
MSSTATVPRVRCAFRISRWSGARPRVDSGRQGCVVPRSRPRRSKIARLTHAAALNSACDAHRSFIPSRLFQVCFERYKQSSMGQRSWDSSPELVVFVGIWSVLACLYISQRSYFTGVHDANQIATSSAQCARAMRIWSQSYSYDSVRPLLSILGHDTDPRGV